MKIVLRLFILIMLFAAAKNYSQVITLVPQDTVLTDTLNSEMIFYVRVTNVSEQDQTLFIVRTINSLPADWSSSLCFDSCFPPDLDSLATTENFGSSPLTPGEEREISIHVLPFTNYGTANIQIKVGTFRNQQDLHYVNMQAVVNPPDAVTDNINPNSFSLQQNYPNPFNPSTKISFSLASRENVQLRIYDILGREVATLINGEVEAGIHSVNFNAAGLASGLYVYKINAGKFSETKKMILEK